MWKVKIKRSGQSGPSRYLSPSSVASSFREQRPFKISEQVCWKATGDCHTPNIRKDSRVLGNRNALPAWVCVTRLSLAVGAAGRPPSLLSWMAVVWLLPAASWFPHGAQLACSLCGFRLRTGSSDQFSYVIQISKNIEEVYPTFGDLTLSQVSVSVKLPVAWGWEDSAVGWACSL